MVNGWLKLLFEPLVLSSQDGMPAGVWRRLLARMVDVVCVLFIQFIFVVTQIFWFMNDLSMNHPREPWGENFAASLTYVGLYIIYEVIFHTYNRGQTPGKLLMHIHVVRESPAVSKSSALVFPTIFQSLIRTIGPILPLLFFVPYPLWASLACMAMGVTVFISDKNRAVHDFITDTHVIYREPTEEDDELISREKDLKRERMEKYSFGVFRRIFKEGQ